MEQVALALLRNKAGVPRLKDGEDARLALVGVQRRADDALIAVGHRFIHIVPILIRHGNVGIAHPLMGVVARHIRAQIVEQSGPLEHLVDHIALIIGEIIQLPRAEDHLPILQSEQSEARLGEQIGGHLHPFPRRQAVEQLKGVRIAHQAGVDLRLLHRDGDPLLPGQGGEIEGGHHAVVLIGDEPLGALIAGGRRQAAVCALPQLYPLYGGDSRPVHGPGGPAGLLIRRVLIRIALAHVLHQGDGGVALIHRRQGPGAVHPHAQPQGEGQGEHQDQQGEQGRPAPGPEGGADAVADDHALTPAHGPPGRPAAPAPGRPAPPGRDHG